MYVTNVYIMIRTQIYLTDDEQAGLKRLSKQLGRSQSEMIRSAIDQFIQATSAQTRLERLRAARGLWKDRDDLPDWTELRKTWDRQ